MDHRRCPFSSPHVPPSLSHTLAQTKERQRLPRFTASEHPTLSRFLQALSFSFRFSSGGPIKRIPELFMLTMIQPPQEHAEQHLTISNMALFPGSLFVGEGSHDIWGRSLKTSMAGKVPYFLIPATAIPFGDTFTDRLQSSHVSP